VLGIGLATSPLFGFTTAAAAGTGALAICIADIASPSRQKAVEMLIPLAVGVAATLLTLLARSDVVLESFTVLGLSFVAALLTAYGRRFMAGSFTVFLLTILALATPLLDARHAWIHTGQLAAGGLVYVAYALAVTRWLRLRTKHQALAECLYEFADYLRTKARFYDVRYDLDKTYARLLARQSRLTERLQGARDFVFRDVRGPRDARLAATLMVTLDLYEHLLSTQTDYALLRRHFGDSDGMVFLRDLTRNGARDLDRLASMAAREREVGARVSYQAELYAFEHWLDLARNKVQAQPGRAREVEIIAGVFRRLRRSIEELHRLHEAYSGATTAKLPSDIDLRPFLSRPSYSPRVLLTALTPGSPIFRHAVRTTLAMGAGLLLVQTLPYFSRGYWILLTIAVIMRSNFSISRQRRTDRVIGNVIGCLLTAALLHLTITPLALLPLLFVAITVSHTFAMINYRVTSTAACIMGLIQLQVLDPSAPFVIGERVIDTFVGAGIAYVFSFVLPSWEYRDIPRLAAGLLHAAQAYVQAALTRREDDFTYRIARKRFLDVIAALSSTAARMLQEPKRHHYAVAQLNDFIRLGYLLGAQLAALRMLLRRRGEQLEPAFMESALAETRDATARELDAAVHALLAPEALAEADANERHPELPGADIPWNTRDLLLHRLRGLEDNVQGLRRAASALKLAW
jgi:uncharacterized membrane protein YccC